MALEELDLAQRPALPVNVAGDDGRAGAAGC